MGKFCNRVWKCIKFAAIISIAVGKFGKLCKITRKSEYGSQNSLTIMIDILQLCKKGNFLICDKVGIIFTLRTLQKWERVQICGKCLAIHSRGADSILHPLHSSLSRTFARLCGYADGPSLQFAKNLQQKYKVTQKESFIQYLQYEGGFVVKFYFLKKETFFFSFCFKVCK